jgi:hypothetical protein
MDELVEALVDRDALVCGRLECRLDELRILSHGIAA